MNQKKILGIGLIVIMLLAIGFFVKNKLMTVPAVSDQPIPTDIAETFDVRVGEKFVGQTGVEITVKQVTEDSRCPANANCVWAGRLVVKADVSFDGGPVQEKSIEVNTVLELPEGKITFTDVKPAKILNGTIKPEEYIFTFSIER
ncbi:MAG TPA: hypothetical protein VK145_02410 [Candidatus Nanoarchaeia archaeon]|nr:hypothetical protein [Candidatus Nanoarchaeia archaeon]